MHRRITGKLVIATHNPGKLAEMRELLSPYGIAAISAGELGLGEPDEHLALVTRLDDRDGLNEGKEGILRLLNATHRDVASDVLADVTQAVDELVKRHTAHAVALAIWARFALVRFLA